MHFGDDEVADVVFYGHVAGVGEGGVGVGVGSVAAGPGRGLG